MYTVYDLTETLACIRRDCPPGVLNEDIEKVVAAHGQSTEGYGEWSGGFLLKLKDGQGYAYISGWCDTTGWGCQDGGSVQFYTIKPKLVDLYSGDWDRNPPDLNKWVKEGAKHRD